MFEKFTEKGRKIIIYAKEEAEKRSNDYLGTEHFLLAILREEDGVPVTILKKMGLSIEEVRYEVEKSLPVGSSLMTFGDIPLPRGPKRSSNLRSRKPGFWARLYRKRASLVGPSQGR